LGRWCCLCFCLSVPRWSWRWWWRSSTTPSWKPNTKSAKGA
jgi:hypothetical protein